MRYPRLFGIFILSSVLSSVWGQVDVLSHRSYTGTSIDPNSHAGANLNETALKKSNVKKGKFGKLVFRLVDGNVYAQPLIVTNAQTPGGQKSMVIVATEHNSVYAIDGDDLNQQSNNFTVWHKDESVFGAHVAHTEVGAKIGAGNSCIDLTTEVGITSTPAIRLTQTTPPKQGVIFVVAKSKQPGTNKHIYKLFALRLSDGQTLGETQIQGGVSGTGFGSQGGMISFNAEVQLNRPALLLHDNILYVAFGGHCDRPKGTENSYHGWLFAYNVSNPAMLSLSGVLCTSPNGRGSADEGRAGIWMSGNSPVVDQQGFIYLATGDGTNDGNRDLGNSVLQVKLENSNIAVKDWFSPQKDLAKREILKIEDVDLGASGPVLLPGTRLLLAAGKEGRMYLINGADMGHGNTTSVDSFQVTHPKDRRYYNVHGAPVVWPRGMEMLVYVNGEEDPLKQYKLVKDASPVGWRFASPKPRNAFGDLVPFKTSCRKPGTLDCISAPYLFFPAGAFGQPNREDVWMPGGFLTLSANGANDGIVWVTMPLGDNANMKVTRGVLRAFDASDVSNQLWDSESTGDANNRLGQFAKFNPPVVANGKVYVGTFQQELLMPGEPNVKDTSPNADRPALVIYGPK